MPETAYFDNAATTFPKPSVVYDYADSFYRNSGGNIGRGGNALAVAAGEIAKAAKSNLKKLYDCPAGEVVFTTSATDALNRILLGLNLAKDDVVYCTPFEHNAVTRPLFHLAETTGIRIGILPFDDETFVPRYEEIEEAFAAQPPRLVVMTHASNVCGAVVPVETVARMAKAYGATTVIDMSQTAGLLPLQLSSDLFDFAVFAGHKTLYGPFGIGGFICKRGAELRPVFLAGMASTRSSSGSLRISSRWKRSEAKTRMQSRGLRRPQIGCSSRDWKRFAKSKWRIGTGFWSA